MGFSYRLTPVAVYWLTVPPKSYLDLTRISANLSSGEITFGRILVSPAANELFLRSNDDRRKRCDENESCSAHAGSIQLSADRGRSGPIQRRWEASAEHEWWTGGMPCLMRQLWISPRGLRPITLVCHAPLQRAGRSVHSPTDIRVRVKSRRLTRCIRHPCGGFPWIKSLALPLPPR